MILEKMKKNKLILGLLLGIIIVVVSVFVLVERERIEPPAAKDPVVEDPAVAPPHPWWLDEAFTRLEAEVIGINVAENYLMVKPLFPPIGQEIKVKISSETIIEKDIVIKKTITDIEKGYLVSFRSREDIREKTEIAQFEWFTAFPSLDEPLDRIKTELPVREKQRKIKHQVFALRGEVIEVNLEENYLRVKPISPPSEQEIKIILEPGFTFEVSETATKTMNDISLKDFIVFDTGEDIREKQVLEKVIRIQLFGDLLQ